MPVHRLTEDDRSRGQRKGGQMVANVRAREAAERRARIVTLIAEGASLDEACERVGVTRKTYSNYRNLHRDFAAAVDAARGYKREYDETIANDFIRWRKHYLGNDTTWFQAQMVDALQDDSAGGGSITMVLFPPEHGKTTTLEDFITWRFCVDKDYRITYGSESQNHSRKALRRIRNRLEIAGPYPKMVADFGPFAPVGTNAEMKSQQPWGQDFFDVYGRTGSDERDYSMVALGFGSAVAGSRTDLLVGDDLCSMKNVAQSEKLLDTFRQDWLSRPGTKGRTVIIGTRVADGDIYDLLEADGLPDFIVRFKAHDPSRIVQFDTPWLWPERYSEAEYARMKRNVGESAWARNYQQQPRAAGDSTFTEDMLAKASHPLRSVLMKAPKEALGIVTGLDPGFGVNATLVCAGNADKLWVLGGKEDEGLTSNQDIAAVVEARTLEFVTRECPWMHVHIEDKAFQKGLLKDASFLDLQERHGITILGHTTDETKYDPAIGIPGMARDFRRGAIELPGADDPDTQAFRAMLDAELIRWRPNVKGTALRMDAVMALWFAWLWWSKWRAGLATRRRPTGPSGQSLPWRPTVLPGGLTEMPA